MGIVFGLVVGLVIAFGIAWYVTKAPIPYLNKGKPQPERPADPRAATTPQAPIALPGKPGEKASEKPRFEFYKILPGSEEDAPGTVAKPEPTPAEKPVPPVEPLFLQAGAFQNPEDADNLKARLALLGLEASVQRADLPEKGIMYRVRMGPYRKPEDMNSARTQLAQSGIQASIVKGK